MSMGLDQALRKPRRRRAKPYPGQVLREARKARGWTLQDVSLATGLPRSTIHRMETPGYLTRLVAQLDRARANMRRVAQEYGVEVSL